LKKTLNKNEYKFIIISRTLPYGYLTLSRGPTGQRYSKFIKGGVASQHITYYHLTPRVP